MQHITGINADTNVNVQNLFIVGRDAVTKVEGQALSSYSHKRTNAVKTLGGYLIGSFDKSLVARWLLDWFIRQFVRRISEYITTSTKG